VLPLFRRQWSNVALRDDILLKLAEHPLALVAFVLLAFGTQAA